MKRVILLVMTVTIALIVAGCSSENGESNDDPVDYTPATEVLEKIDNEETFAFVFGDKECPACQSYLENGLKDMDEDSDIKLDYVELNGIEEKQDEFEAAQVILSEHLDGQFEATPSTYFIVDGELQNIVVGAVTHDELLKEYEEYIK